MKRLLNAATCGLSALAVLVAAAAAGPAKAETTLRYWTFLEPTAAGPRSEAQRQMIKGFEDANPGVKVSIEVVHWSKIVPMLITAVGAGNAPDVALIHSSRMTMAIDAGSVIPLDKYAAGLTDKDKADFLLPYDQFLEKGQLYSLPIEHRVESILMYRQDLIEKAGFKEPPKTWEQLVDVGKKIAMPERWAFVWPLSRKDSAANVKILQSLYWSKGGRFFDDNGRAAVNSPVGIEIAEKFKALATQDKIMPTTAIGVEEGRTMMKSGATAMYVDGTQVFTSIAAGAGIGRNLASAPLPRLDAQSAAPLAIVAGQTLAVSSNSKHPDVAWKFVSHMVSPEAQAISGKVGGNLPVRASAYDDPWFKTEDARELVAWRDYIKAGARANEAHELSDYMNDSLALAYEQILSGRVQVKAALDQAAERFNRRVDQQKRRDAAGGKAERAGAGN
jgi:ABC-type glycerol-3-phosphate transport system substrate-binding protein